MGKSNEISRNYFSNYRDSVLCEKQTEILKKLTATRASEFDDIKKEINPNKLIYNFNAKGKTPKDFRNDQMPIELFENLRGSNIELLEVLRDQVKFKSSLNEIKIWGKKSVDQKNTNKKDYVVFGLRDYPFLLSYTSYKLKYGKGLKTLIPKQMLQRFATAIGQVVAGNNSKIY